MSSAWHWSQKSSRRVAGEGELGGDDQRGARVAGRLDRVTDALRVAGEIAHGRVDLGDGDLHAGREAPRSG